MSPTVNQVINNERNACIAARNIITILKTLTTKEQIIALAMVNRTMDHHIEKAHTAYDRHAVMEAMNK